MAQSLDSQSGRIHEEISDSEGEEFHLTPLAVPAQPGTLAV